MTLTDYNILKLIGKGTYGEVHLVTHKKDKKQYVIKKLEFLKASAKERKSAEQEAKLLSNLRHPNIVSYKDSFQSESGHLFIVMGFAEGGDLYTKLREQREKKEPLGEVQTVRWYIQICMALQYLHERRILHRDLKTQNIFLTKTQIIKVGDLGIAKELESASDMATTLIGTPYYMSPELFSNRPYNHKSDVWALGCCMYEMVTLKHAFNAKDINSLMYKILKGRIPAMPEEYPPALCDLIRDMLSQNPEKRPSVNKILRNSYIKKHIHLFLEESSTKRKVSSDKSRRSSAASNGNHSSRKKSTNSQGSSPSPHPPSAALDPSKPSRPRARSPNVSPPSKVTDNVEKNQEPKRLLADKTQHKYDEHSNHGPQRRQSPSVSPPSERKPSKGSPINEMEREPKRHLVDDIQHRYDKHSNHGPQRRQSPNVSPPSERKPSKGSPINVTEREPKRHLVDDIQHRYDEPSNYGSQKIIVSPPTRSSPILPRNGVRKMYETPKIVDSGIYVNFHDAPRIEKTDVHQKNSKAKPHTGVPSPITNRKDRVPSSSSSSSSSRSSTSQTKSRRPLPDPSISREPRKKESLESLNNSGESMVSVSSVADSITGTKKSARQRRRENKQKESLTTPAIVEEIRKSRSTGFKHGIRGKTKTKEKYSDHACGDKNTNVKEYYDTPDSKSSEGYNDIRSKEVEVLPQIIIRKQSHQNNEEEEFMTLLHTTLHLGSGKESLTGDGDSPISVEENDPSRTELSPVLEVTEGSRSDSNQHHPLPRMTPAATPVYVHDPAANLMRNEKRNISANTLHSTQRLMDRIVALRKECIQGLGVPLLHKAYEVLDANQDDEPLKDELITLLGQVRFEKWSGKIWQLKYCEESLFGHCGSLTAY